MAATVHDYTSWLGLAEGKLGTREVPGAGNNKEIVSWGKEAGISWYTKDSIPWCAVFVNWLMVENNYPSTNSAMARSFHRYGTQLKEPIPGAIFVQPRTSDPQKGHVGIVRSVDRSRKTFTTVEGNVGDAVTSRTQRWNSVLKGGLRWPPGAPLPPNAKVVGRIAGRREQEPLELGDRIIQRGDSGADVEELQTALHKLGYMRSNDPMISAFGPSTEDALRSFQRAKSLEIDGVAGPASVAAIEAELAAKSKRKRVVTDTGCKVVGGAALGGVAVAAGAAKEIGHVMATLSDVPAYIVIGGALVGVAYIAHLSFKAWMRHQVAA